MAILRQIAQLGQSVLREPARAIANPADPAVQTLIDDMLATVAPAICARRSTQASSPASSSMSSITSTVSSSSTG